MMITEERLNTSEETGIAIDLFDNDHKKPLICGYPPMFPDIKNLVLPMVFDLTPNVES